MYLVGGNGVLRIQKCLHLSGLFSFHFPLSFRNVFAMQAEKHRYGTCLLVLRKHIEMIEKNGKKEGYKRLIFIYFIYSEAH